MIFRGKRVALIGPAPIRVDERETIDSCDLVVRINQALPIPEDVAAKTTGRCEVLYVWRKIQPVEEWEEVRHIRLKTDALFDNEFYGMPTIYKYERFRDRIGLIEPEHFYSLSKKVGCRANTGMCAISEICDDLPAMLYITGITFYQGPVAYRKGYVSDSLNRRITLRKGNFAKHRQEPQLAYFKQYFYPLPFVKCSEELDGIVQSFTI